MVQPTLRYHITNNHSHCITPTHLKSAQYSLHNNAESSRKLLKMDVLTSETYWAVNWHNKASVIKLVYLYSKFCFSVSYVLYLQLREAIENANSGNISSPQPPNITLTPPPGSGTKNDLSLASDPRCNDSIISMDSALSCNTAASETDIEDSVNNSRLWWMSYLLVCHHHYVYDDFSLLEYDAW